METYTVWRTATTVLQEYAHVEAESPEEAKEIAESGEDKDGNEFDWKEGEDDRGDWAYTIEGHKDPQNECAVCDAPLNNGRCPYGC